MAPGAIAFKFVPIGELLLALGREELAWHIMSADLLTGEDVLLGDDEDEVFDREPQRVGAAGVVHHRQDQPESAPVVAVSVEVLLGPRDAFLNKLDHLVQVPTLAFV